MTNELNPTNAESRDASFDALADAMLDDDANAFDIFERLIPFLPFFDRIDLAARLDICPLHICDIAICADDNILDCAEYRS